MGEASTSSVTFFPVKAAKGDSAMGESGVERSLSLEIGVSAGTKMSPESVSVVIGEVVANSIVVA